MTEFRLAKYEDGRIIGVFWARLPKEDTGIADNLFDNGWEEVGFLRYWMYKFLGF
jgi:hypothetical protein